MKVSIHRFRWIFLALYVAVIAFLLGLGFSKEKHDQ